MCIRKHQDKDLAHVPVTSDNFRATAIATKLKPDSLTLKKGKSKNIQILDLESCNSSVSLSESDIAYLCILVTSHFKCGLTPALLSSSAGSFLRLKPSRVPSSPKWGF